MPVTLGWAGGMGTGVGSGVVLFFGNVPHVCPTAAGAGWGDCFFIWPERGLPNESQVNNTF